MVLIVAGSACVGGAAGSACALAADAAGSLAVGWDPLWCGCCCWYIVHAGTASSAGAAGFKLPHRNPVSVALFGAQQADSQQGC